MSGDIKYRPEAEDLKKERAAIASLRAIAFTIRDLDAARNGAGIPSGELYAMLMGMISYNTYAQMIAKFKELGLITEHHNLIRWVGPKEEKQ